MGQTGYQQYRAARSRSLPETNAIAGAQLGRDGSSPGSLMTVPATPCFVIRERDLLQNLVRIRILKQRSGGRVVLALKCFSAWGVFDILRPYLDGTTSSSPFEARLGFEKFGG